MMSVSRALRCVCVEAVVSQKSVSMSSSKHGFKHPVHLN